MERLCASDPGRCRDHFHRSARRIRSDRGGQSRRSARPRKRHDSVFAAVGFAWPSDQSVRQRSSAGAAALCDHGPVARPVAASRCALSHQQCDIAEAGFCAAGLRNAPWRPARPDERLGRRQCARALARGRAAAHRRRHSGGNARRRHRSRQHARRLGAALAGSDPAQRCDAQCAYPCGDRDRPHRPCHQHARYISRRAVAGSDLSVAMFRALLVCRTERHQAAPARKAYGQTGAARRIRTCGAAGAARRRRHRILLCRRSGGHGRLHLAERRTDQRPLARRRVTRTPA